MSDEPNTFGHVLTYFLVYDGHHPSKLFLSLDCHDLANWAELYFVQDARDNIAALPEFLAWRWNFCPTDMLSRPVHWGFLWQELSIEVWMARDRQAYPAGDFLQLTRLD